jgi:hypothetical protein
MIKDLRNLNTGGLMRNFISNLMIVLVIFLWGVDGFSQTSKHPRVVELEKALSKEALEILKGRFPDKPFLVTVKIDAMMRERKLPGSMNKEKLPYFEISEEEMVDEWDDPAVPLLTLINRVKKIQVNLSVPNQLSDDEISELKSSVVYNLGLIEARDMVEVNKRSWNSSNVESESKFRWDILGFGVTGVLAILAGLFMIIWVAASKLSSAIHESSINSKGNGGGVINAQINSPSGGSNNDQGKGGNFGSADLRLQDPIKNREIIATGFKILQTHPNFPNLEDMIVLQKAAEDNPSDLGALLGEFPVEIRQKLFSFSYGDKWMEAMIDPSDVSSHSIEILNKCLKNPRNDLDKEWQQLLIGVWRLADKKKEFFAGLSSSEAFSILGFLPKSFALEAAREAFPGAWGQLLDPSFSPKRLGRDKISEFTDKAFKILPLRDLSVLENYKNEKELLSFLKFSDPVAEKEIYLASGEASLLWAIRPPFFKIFELGTVEYDKIVTQFRIEDWALAMFNVGRLERREIEKRMTDKQKFRYFEMLKSYDFKTPSKTKIGEIRESIGRTIYMIQEELKTEQGLQEHLESKKEAPKVA